MKLTTMTQVTVDGVMQGNGGATDEDLQERIRARRMGHGGGRQRDHGVHQRDLPAGRRVPVRPADLRTLRRLLGRRAGLRRGGRSAQPPDHRCPEHKAQYLVSTTLTEPRWADTTVLSGDVAEAIGELKAKPGVSRRCTAAAPWSGGCSITTSSTR